MPLALVLGVLLCVLGVVGAVLSRMRPHPFAHQRLRGALVLALVGACLISMLVFRSEASQQSECDIACREWGLPPGLIAPASRSRARACVCGEGPAAHALYELNRFGSALPATPPREGPRAPRSRP